MAVDFDSTNEPPAQMFTILKTVSRPIGQRLGRLSFVGRKSIDTPHYLGLTSRGTIPHLSQDKFAFQTGVSAVYTALEDFIERDSPPILHFHDKDANSPLRRFIALPDDTLLVLGARRTPPVAAPAANSNTDSYIAVCTSVGFRSLDVGTYMQSAETLRPDIVVAAGDIPYQRALGSKRVLKATDRMCQWITRLTEYRRNLDDNLHLAKLFAPLLPVSSAKQQSYVDCLAQDVRDDLGGLALYSLDSLHDLPEQLSSLPRLGFTSPTTPQQVLDHIAAGLDLVTIPFVTVATDSGIALDFTFPPHDDTAAKSPDAGTLPLGKDLWSSAYSTDLSPLTKDCACYACRMHHKAYVQHLLNAKEMLAWVLLQIHNHHILDSFFAGVRKSIKSDNFEADRERFARLYDSTLPEKTGQGPRVRGYQFKSERPGEPKKNQPSFRTLNENAEKLAEADRPAPSANADGLQRQGLGQPTRAIFAMSLRGKPSAVRHRVFNFGLCLPNVDTNDYRLRRPFDALHRDGGVLMASLTESSVGSVPFAQLEHLREQLLKTTTDAAQRNGLSTAGGNDIEATADCSASQTRTRTRLRTERSRVAKAVPDAAGDTIGIEYESPSAEGLPCHAHPPDNVWIVDSQKSRPTDRFVLESTGAFRTPPTSLPKPPRPPLPLANSAPEAEMDTLLDPISSQRAFADLRRGVSFHGYPGGDTQPMDSQIYEDYRARKMNGGRGIPEAQGAEEQSELGHDPAYEILDEHSTDFIDLEAAWMDQDGRTSPTQPSAEDEEDTKSDEPLNGTQSTRLHVPPQTPALAGQKRRAGGEIVTSAPTTTTRTPGFSQFFGQGLPKVPVLSATQLFNQTQVPTSPMPGDPRSDPITSRPSPNIRMSSLSPVIRPTSSPIVSVHEPRERYTSRRESQERKVNRLRQDIGFGDLLEDDDYDSDFDYDISQNTRHRHRLRRTMSDHCLITQGRAIDARRPGPVPNTRHPGRITIDLVTPPTIHAEKLAKTDDFADDTTGARFDVLSLQSDHDDRDQGGAGDGDDDVYDELGETALRNQAAASGGRVDQDPPVEELDLDVRVDSSTQNANPTQDRKSDPIDRDAVSVRQSSLSNDSASRGHPAGSCTTSLVPAPVRFVAASQDEYQPFRRATTAEHQSSMTSVVPGSQYVASTTMDQVRQKGSSQSVPSPRDAVPADSTGALTIEQNMIAHARQFPMQTSLEQPVSDDMGSTKRGTVASGHERQSISGEASNNTSAPFLTAKSHTSSTNHTSSSLPTGPQDVQHSSHETPRRAAGIMHLLSIDNDPSPLHPEGDEEVDFDAIMGGVMTNEDRQFIEMISSPPARQPAKRRRTKETSSFVEIPEAAKTIPAARHAFSEMEWNGVEMPQEREISAASLKIDGVGAPDEKSEVLRISPSKANELPRSTPAERTETNPDTPESVREREKAGGQAVSQLLSSRSSIGLKKITAERRKRLLSTDRRNVRPKESRMLAAARKQPTPSRKITSDPPTGTTTNTKDAGKTVNGTSSTPHEDSATDTTGIIAPDRVFALFKGSYHNFYPGTCLSSSFDCNSHRIEFEDGNVLDVEGSHVRRLELRPGDMVKVDVKDMRNKTWLVCGLSSKSPESSIESQDGVDIFGHRIVRVRAKTDRATLQAVDAANMRAHDVIEVSIAAIYLTPSMWAKYQDRAFLAANEYDRLKKVRSRPTTPAVISPSQDMVTPASRSRKAARLAQTRSLLREGSAVASANVTPRLERAAAFTNMAFAISYTSGKSEKDEIARSIRRNGGAVLESGFDELFELPLLASSDPQALRVKPEFSQLGFVALITDKHSRREKYMQALALGLPTLSAQFITDCLDPSQALIRKEGGGGLPPWGNYLLPAGESLYLRGAIRSRMLTPYSCATAKLADVTALRSQLLRGEGVLLVAPKDKAGKGSAAWEKRKAYTFLTLALGAGRIHRTDGLEETRKLIEEDTSNVWRWVYVDSNVDEAAEFLSRTKQKAGQGKKRKREAEAVVGSKAYMQSMCKAVGDVKVVHHEFVVQSLILGALIG